MWSPRAPNLLELNFVGIDPARDPTDAYVLDDDQLPLLVFGALSLVKAGEEVTLAATLRSAPPGRPDPREAGDGPNRGEG